MFVCLLYFRTNLQVPPKTRFHLHLERQFRINGLPEASFLCLHRADALNLCIREVSIFPLLLLPRGLLLILILEDLELVPAINEIT